MVPRLFPRFPFAVVFELVVVRLGFHRSCNCPKSNERASRASIAISSVCTIRTLLPTFVCHPFASSDRLIALGRDQIYSARAIKLNSTHGPIKMTERPISVRDNILTDWCQPNGHRPNAAVPTFYSKGRACFNHDQAFASKQRIRPKETGPTKLIQYTASLRITFVLKFSTRAAFLTGSLIDPPLYRRASLARIPSIELGQPRRRRLITPWRACPRCSSSYAY